MRTFAAVFLACAAGLACSALSAQVQGHLRFEAAGHAPVILELVDGGHPAFMAIARQRGVEDAAALRLFVLTHTGPEGQVLPEEVKAKRLKAPASTAWKVDHNGACVLLATSYATFWRYTPGLVMPVRFKLGRDEWRLIAADLPPKMLVSDGDD